MISSNIAFTSAEDVLDAHALADGMCRATSIWHTQNGLRVTDGELCLQMHRANYDLWHLEDRARDPRAPDSTLARVKRDIDRVNQTRNDLVERIDTEYLEALAKHGLPNGAAPLHSETPGLMMDRLSILSLKLFHTEEEINRKNASPAHVEHNCGRLSVLQQQSHDLTECLSELWLQVCRGERQFKLYRQMKMYNDPELNPVLYQT